MWDDMRRGYGYDVGSGAQPDSPKARMAATMQHFVDHVDEAPVIVLACLVAHREADATIGSSVYPACQNLLLAARGLGYGGVLTLWHEPVEDELRSVLGIPDEVLIAATIPLGRPQGSHGPVRRRPIGELVFDGGWDEPAPWAVDPAGTRFAGRPSSRA
jgi:nitroreductase